MTTASITLRQPTQITLGPGCATAAILAFVRAAGSRRIFLLTSPSVLPQGLVVAEALRAESIVVEVATGVPPEPTTACCEQIRIIARVFAPDLVLALGGGSVLDVAKLVAALHDRPEPVSAFYGINVLACRRTGLVCVPTTAGTGSEVSPNALLLDETAVAKKAVISPALVPDAAIIDPALMVSLPPALTRRNKLLVKLADQIALAQAQAEGRTLSLTRQRSIKDASTGERRDVTVPKRVREWWFAGDTGKLNVTLKYGSKQLDLARGKNAIELGGREELVPVLQKLKAAVEAGELDAQIEAVSGAMRSRFVK
jgi:hypothetical protein